MKKSLKKILSIMLAVLLLTAALAGCAAKEDEPADVVEEVNNKLTVWLWDENFNGGAMKKAAEIYKAAHPEFELELVIKADSSECEELLTVAGNSGDYSELPDIVLMQDNSCQKFISVYPEMYADLTDSVIDFSKIAAGKTAFSVVDGKNYGVGFDSGTALAAYRTDILEATGYTIEDLTDITWAEWLEIAKDVKAQTGYPLLSDPLDSSDTIMIMLKSTGSALFDANGDVYIEDNQDLYDVIETYQSLVDAGVLQRAADWGGYTSTIADGSVAGVINGAWIIATMATADNDYTWQMTNLPKIEGGTNYSSNGGSSWTVLSSGDVDLATQFLAETFVGSADLYAEMLLDETCGAIGNYLPAADTDAYSAGLDIFGGDAVYSRILEFGDKVPAFATGAYYYDARDAVSTAAAAYAEGADLAAELATAQETVEFAMN